MIKTLVIVALLVVLGLGMMLTRPSEQSFKDWYHARAQTQSGNFIEKLFKGGSINAYLDNCTYKNRLLWADVEKDGQTVYSGAFNHWFARGGGSEGSGK